MRAASEQRRGRRGVAAGLLALAAAAGCDRVAELRERVAPPSPHERYVERLRAAGLETTALGSDWLREAASAVRLAPLVALPAREAAYFAPGEAGAVGFRARVRRGQRVTVELASSGGAPALVFVDLFRVTGDSTAGRPPGFERLASADSAAGVLEAVADEDGEVVVRVQPELLRGGRFTVTLRAGASLAFPVEGRGARAVQSFWGAARDGGRRRHEGVDIFAPRGTPAVAATAGLVTRVHTTAIGGKVVWLRDDGAPQSLYYAHLDAQRVTPGQRVAPGDTLGVVGNTGNAITTRPHLHFGVYRRGGAVDPFPFVNEPREAPPTLRAGLEALGGWRRVREATTPRPAPGAAPGAGPDTPAAAGGGGALPTLARRTVVRVVGAAGDSYRVRLPDGTAAGYVRAAALETLEPLEPATARLALRAGTPVLDRPAAGAATMDSVAAGSRLRAVGRFGGYAAVRTPAGRLGWVAEGAL